MDELASSAVVGGLRGDEGGRYGSADCGFHLIHTQRQRGIGKQAFADALVFEISWDFSAAAPAVSAALPRTPAVEEMCTTGTLWAVCGGFDEAFCPPPESSHSCRGHCAVPAHRRCRADLGGVPDDTTTMSSSGSNPNPRSSTRAETTPPLVRRAGPGRRGRDGREGEVCLALESGRIQVVGGAQRPPLTKFELTIADSQHPSTRQPRGKPLFQKTTKGNNWIG